MKSILPRSVLLGVGLLSVAGFAFFTLQAKPAVASFAARVASPYIYTFNSNGTLSETGDMGGSWSPYWWVNSGAYALFESGVGKTVHGSLSWLDPWRLLYAVTNPRDTDNGFHPQNIFRFLTRSKWQDFEQSVYMKVVRDNRSDSPNRAGHNGLLTFNRYQDGDNLYYTGIRVDGLAVIKKKKNGQYYTMATKRLFAGDYNRYTMPNVLPHGSWLGIRTKVESNSDGSVDISLYYDNGKTGRWRHVMSVRDTNSNFGGAPITNAGYAGIRTDFMDVEFEDYKIIEI